MEASLLGVDPAPFWLSLRVSGTATLIALLFGIPLAWLLARRTFPGRRLVEVAVILPMVLPPTVLGYYLLVSLGRQSWIGRTFEALGFGRIVFTPTAAVIAALVASFPFLVRAAQSGFEQVDSVYEEAARTLGKSEWKIALGVTLPLAWRGIAAGIALGFARAMGEFGTTMMLAGNIPGQTQTASLAIYDAVQGGRAAEAGILAILLSGITGLALLIMSRLGREVGR